MYKLKYNNYMPLFIIIAFYAVITLGDWIFRFQWYGWHNRIFILSASEANDNNIHADDVAFLGPGQPLTVNHRPEGRGGNLSHLIPVDSGAVPFTEPRPAMDIVYDEFGFLNNPPVKDHYFPVLVAGDSFMTAQTTMSNTLAGLLARELNVGVYNYAFAGYGATFAIQRFIDDPRFLNNPPRILLWGLYEQHLISTRYWPELYDKISSANKTEKATGSAGGSLQPKTSEYGTIDWNILAPKNLGMEIKKTSIMAQQFRNMREILKYHILDQLPDDLIPREDVGILFCRWTIDDMALNWEERNSPYIVNVISMLSEHLRQRNIQLLVFLIPAKENVYRSVWPDNSIEFKAVLSSEDNLLKIANALSQLDIPAIHLLPEFRTAVDRGTFIYWRDDTHWNPTGAALAARLIGNEIKERGLLSVRNP